jgi:predicted Fe-Mo cluster-binding NifX family protein
MITFPVKTDKENAAVSPLFGKAKYFAFYDGKSITVEKNPYERGSRLADWFLQKGVDTIIIKEIGSKPFNKIIQTNIKILSSGNERITTNEVIEKFNNGELKELSKNELKEIIKEHEGKKDASSCGSHNHEHGDKHGGGCHQKMKNQNPNVFL